MAVRQRIRVTGTVQGVGFRPFVHRQAVSLGLLGTVRNDQAGVLIEVEGRAADIDELCRRLREDPPPLARVTSVDASLLDDAPDRRPEGFTILASATEGEPTAPVGVDTGTCPDCRAELADPTDRRFRHPFLNCTNCGPRYTIIQAVPYDRAATTMAAFAMCVDCRREFDDPVDRRFHAQPNACPACGPTLAYRRPDGGPVAEGPDALRAAVAALERGAILAVKGVGGYHLAVDAEDLAAVTELRRRKARDEKPFAVMVADRAQAERLVVLDEAAAAALGSPRRPVVLAPRRPGTGIADPVAPGLPDLGVLLAYTPVHHLLLESLGRPLVMTSGNRSDEPIAHEDDDAVARLGPMVDGILAHDRRIHIRCDDSVVRSVGGRPQVLRRSRGYAPEPLALLEPARRPVLAVGAELKATVSVAKGELVFTSHHLGDLEHPAAFASFTQAVEHLCRLFAVEPEVVAHDLHPEYLSTKWALDTDLPTVGVQHHHAHVVSCLVEHGHPGPVLGLAFDGLGYGCDRTLWGGELLVADLAGSERVGHLRPVSLPGGAAAIREPWRMAVAWAHAVGGRELAVREGERHDDRAAALVDLVESGAPPTTTSVGRLFDAVAALLGIRSRVSYEGQAAIELEARARTVPRSSSPAYPVPWARDGELTELDPRPLLAEVLAERDRGRPVPVIAAGFHEGLGRAAAGMAAALAVEQGLDTVALSGGVFQNPRLTEVVESALLDQGLEVLVHRLVPPNDGGISVGQAAVAAHGREPVGG